MAYNGGAQSASHHAFPGSQAQGPGNPHASANLTSSFPGSQAPGQGQGNFHAYSGSQASGQGNPQAFGNPGPSGQQQQYSEMYPHQGGPGHYNEYNGNNNMHPSYGQQQDYYGQGQMYDQNMGSANGPGQGSYMMQQGKPQQTDRGEPMKILRNPFPAVSNEITHKSNETYDPSYPTGPSERMGQNAHNQFHQQQQQRVAPPPPSISGMHPGASTMSNAGPQGGLSQQTAPMYNTGQGLPQDNGYNVYGNGNMYDSGVQNQPQTALAQPANFQPLPTAAPYANNTQQIQQESPGKSKMQVMTGVVTQVQPGAFGMVSEEIFFQEAVVSGPLPKVGDKVVVEAEAVNGMPFKYNAKRVTRLDVDLVREDKAAPSAPAFQQQPPQFQNQQPLAYQTTLPSQQHYQNIPDDRGSSRFDAHNFGPLPSLPDSLNLPRPVPPPNLASVLPTSSDSHAPLKSILKRRGSPSLKRNPPPPPLISKNADKEDFFKSSAPSSLKQNVFSVDLERDVPRVLPPHGGGPPMDFPEYTFFNRERPKKARSPSPPPISPRITRLLPQSPIPEYVGGRSNSVDGSRGHRQERSRSRDRNSSRRRRSRSRSKSPKSRSLRRSRSRSASPRRSRRSRSRSFSPGIPRSISPRRIIRSHSRSPGSTRRRRFSRSPSPRTRRISRSPSPKSRRRSRSTSRDRHLDSRRGRNYRDRRSSRSRSRSPSHRTRHSSDHRRSRSNSPNSSTKPHLKAFEEVVTHGIVVKRVTSDLFPKLVSRDPDSKELEIIRRDGKGKAVTKATGPAPTPVVPIKFQIANPAKTTPVAPSSIVPNPTFKAANMVPPPIVQNPAYQWVEAKTKKKKPKEQEPAFRIVENDKQPQQQQKNAGSKSSSETDKSKTTENLSTPDKLLRNPANILHLKQTIQNDLQELRSKGQSDVGKKLLENPTDIEKLKQTVQKDLESLRSKESALSAASGSKETNNRDTNSPVINKTFDDEVEKRLKDLRSKFETHIKDAKATLSASNKPATATKPSSEEVPKPKQTVTLVADNLKDGKNIPSVGPRPPRKTTSNASFERSRGRQLNRRESPAPKEPAYDEQMEKLQEEIHQQRFMEEENRLKSIGDRAGLEQLYYMEDRRRRRMDERHLARLRKLEIQLKQEKKFGELAKLREEWGPPAQRLEQERELREMRLNEEHRDNQLQGQAEAIQRQEYEYQRWLEEEAAARRRGLQEAARASRGCEGRVLRRRTPSPSSLHKNQQGPPQHGPPRGQHGPPPDVRGPHPLRRRSRSPSYERYQQDWHRRHPRDRSPPMNYEQFAMRYPIGPPPHAMHPDMHHPPNHPNFHGPLPPPHHFIEQEGFFVSRLDDVNRRQDELMMREREIQERMEMAQRRIGGGPPHRDRDDGREEIRRYAVPRR